MCGRFSLFADDAELVGLFDIDLVEGVDAASSASDTHPTWQVRYNIAPSQPVLVVMGRMAPPSSSAQTPDAAAPVRKLRPLQWGLVPHWAKTSTRPLINARSETVLDKPTFRRAIRSQRCLVPANGYFEWQVGGAPDGRGKQPWFISAGPGDPVFAFAGIYEAWRDPVDPDGQWLLTCAILTRATPPGLDAIHERTPLVVPPHSWDQWLDPMVTSKDRVAHLMARIPQAKLETRAVGTAVGNVRSQGPDLVRPVDEWA
ncbi:SOS response-associated peptidase [Schaalia sp. 19OD2882]|uniref:SOS response-associated peptidase n=1 Tax=Schaalia sp. 19OD2882 TaxID=2794089 RepID=UPI001C1EE78D|nr:SOS response-associated peptidase [Schaalia sp. 19OD2882]QWW19696.1 SOS response-associated peptidase [Schaalia sp. 19OD2882]